MYSVWIKATSLTVQQREKNLELINTLIYSQIKNQSPILAYNIVFLKNLEKQPRILNYTLDLYLSFEALNLRKKKFSYLSVLKLIILRDNIPLFLRWKIKFLRYMKYNCAHIGRKTSHASNSFYSKYCVFSFLNSDGPAASQANFWVVVCWNLRLLYLFGIQ